MMGSLYGHRWASSYGEVVDPDRVWTAALAGVTEQQIRRGLRQCVAQGYDWPPTAPEFRKLCTGASAVDWEHKRIAAADRERDERRLLEDSQRASEREGEADAHRAAIRAMLRF